MNTKAIAFAVIAAMLAQPALAQDNAAGSTAAGSTATTTSGAAAGSTATPAGRYQDFDAFLESLGTADFTAATTGLEEGTSTYNVVSVASLPNADAARLQQVIEEHTEELTALRATIQQNEEAIAYLEDEGLTHEHVVWVDRNDDGTVNLYVSTFE